MYFWYNLELSILMNKTQSKEQFIAFVPSVDLHNKVAPHKSIRVPSVNTLFSVGTAGPWTAALRDSRNPKTLPPTLN